MLSMAPALVYYDITKVTVVSADASSFGLGAALLQVHDGTQARGLCARDDTIREATCADTDMQMVIRYNHEGWPKHVPYQLKGYSTVRAALSAEDGLLLYGDRTKIPASLREEVLE
ncbi:hypothetical protein AAFF_G00191780 [Aldrovandia affinis]|uniref:Reverse transcriptase/retrotransposon-derived protein RNase H-like domain-containing protein n=1 Tax=Aldrovandia affinis TaxID=143900 RepID=A0AAD7RLW6_9TELE|nr:hypothetical protein AAFF_G00191780 [Aldrovandia affinis]